MTVNHFSEFLKRFQPLPLEAGAPMLEEFPCPNLALVVPELAERLLEQIGGIEPFICRQQNFQRSPSIHAQVLAVRQQGVFLPLDEAAIIASQSCVLSAAHFVRASFK